MTTTTIACGYMFSENAIYDPSNWGTDCTDDEAKKLGDAVVSKFDELANARFARDDHAESISLIAGTSEVYGDYNALYSDDMDLEAIIAEASQWVFEHMSEII